MRPLFFCCAKGGKEEVSKLYDKAWLTFYSVWWVPLRKQLRYFTTLPHPPYSPNLEPCHYFSTMEEDLCRHKCATIKLFPYVMVAGNRICTSTMMTSQYLFIIGRKECSYLVTCSVENLIYVIKEHISVFNLLKYFLSGTSNTDMEKIFSNLNIYTYFLFLSLVLLS